MNAECHKALGKFGWPAVLEPRVEPADSGRQAVGIPCACSPNRRFSDNGTALPGTLKRLAFRVRLHSCRLIVTMGGSLGCGTLTVSPAVDAPAILSYLYFHSGYALDSSYHNASAFGYERKRYRGAT